MYLLLPTNRGFHMNPIDFKLQSEIQQQVNRISQEKQTNNRGAYITEYHGPQTTTRNCRFITLGSEV